MGTVRETGAGMDKPPKLGLKYKLNHEFELDTFQFFKPRLNQLAEMIPLTARYMKFYIGKKMSNKRPFMDMISTVTAQRKYGCPIGGIGGGTIGRGFKGEFCRFQVYPGIYEYQTVPECQFIVNIRNANKETIFQSVLSTYDKPKEAPESWEWNLNPEECEYTALYPKAWTTYDLSKYGVKLVCRQISPIIPNNYKDSSLPCAVFVFSAENVSNEHRDVSITFTWTEVLATSNKKKTAAKLDLERYSDEYTSGVTLEQKIEDTPCTFAISKKKEESETIHEGYCLWSAAQTSSYVWNCLKKNGRLVPDPSYTPPPPNGANADKKAKQKKISKCDSVALSSVISLNSGETGSTEFSLVWDMPVIKYDKCAKLHRRYYTKYFGSDGTAGTSIATYALRNYKNWEKQIAEWQDPIFNNSNIPDWLKGALMNELYFVADGGSVWFDVRDEYPETDPRHEFGIYGYLEGHEYRMYNTYDVHFYASFALAQLWPNLQVVLQYMFREAIPMETNKFRTHLFDGKVARSKVKNSIPHDLGDPDDVPFTKINAYNIFDVSEWRDLNLKFILQVMRDYKVLRGHTAPFGSERYQSMAFIDDVRAGTEDDLYSRATGQADFSPPESPRSPPPVIAARRDCGVGEIVELLYSRNTAEEPDVKENGDHLEPRESAQVWDAKQYLSDMYDSCVILLRRAMQWDKDGDGIIENMGIPDQTFDAWIMNGPSAYCGGLWLASISMVRAMAAILGHEEDEREFGKLLEKAQNSYETKLWTGSYYKFDLKPSNSNVVMADQLAGQWYLRASGWTEQVFPSANVRKALDTIFAHNVEQFCRGGRGAVNGFITGARAGIDISAVQSEEVWTGVTYGLAALMIFEGMHKEAFVTAGGLYDSLVRMGLAFETPEALYEDGRHRSVAYMRPLAIWGIYQALLARPPAPTTQTAQTNGQAHQATNNTNL